jgi:CO/xanthine dehydrogenase Mo-binding subunit
MGGNFGSRGDTLIAVVAALFAQKTGKATKIVLSRAESLLGSSKAPSVNIRYKTGATREGRIVAVDTEVIHGAGTWAPYLIPETTKGAELCYFETLDALLSHATGPYEVPNVRARAYDVLTNGPRYVPLRGTNANYLPLAYESQLDQIAEKLGMDPFEIRTLNAIRKGSKTHIGQVLRESVSLLAELEALRPHYEKAKTRLEKRRAKADGSWKPGVGIGCGWRNIGYVKTTISAGAELTDDGFIHVLAGSVEQGQGPTTQLVQIAADVFGVSMSTMRVTIGDTSAAPYPVPTFSSITTVATGKAIQTAAVNLAKLLKGTAAQLLEEPPDSLQFNDQGVFAQEGATSSVSFAELSAYLHDQGKSSRCEGVIEWDGEAPNILFGYNTGLIELEVNVESGRVRLLNHVNVCDPGTRINPLALEGQVDGGIAFGIGFALSECFHPDNPPTLKDYGVSATTDIPETITQLFVEEPLERGPFGAKSMAEHPGISPIPAIINGIYNATGARIYDIPATPERIKFALLNNRNHSNKVRGEKITL